MLLWSVDIIRVFEVFLSPTYLTKIKPIFITRKINFSLEFYLDLQWKKPLIQHQDERNLISSSWRSSSAG